MRSVNLLALFALLSSPGTASAQEVPPIALLVEDVSEAGKQCGLSEDFIDATLRSAARYNRLAIQSGADHTLYVNVTTLVVSGVCVSSWQVALYGYGYSGFGENQRFSRHVFCEDGGMVSYFKGSRSSVAQSLREGLDSCLAYLAK